VADSWTEDVHDADEAFDAQAGSGRRFW